MTTVKSTTVPLHSRLATRSADAYFADAYELALSRPPSCALAVYLHAVGQTPAWVERLMAIRNRIVGTLGLKNLGAMGAVDASKPLDAYRAGDRVGIFVIDSLDAGEVVLKDDDKHLSARISVCLSGEPRGSRATVSTVVHVHNVWGRIYLFFVVPVHKIIVPAMLKRLEA